MPPASDTKKKRLIKEIGGYSFSSQTAQIITLAAAILSRRFLGPVQMGIWGTLQIVTEYAKYSSLGTLYAVSRRIPYYEGKGETQMAGCIKNAVFTFLLGSSALLAGGLILFAVLTRGMFSHEITTGLFVIAAVIFLQRINDFLVSLLRAYRFFAVASSQMIYSAVVNVLLVGFFTYHFKIYGFLFSVVASLLFNIVYIHFRQPFGLRLVPDFKLIKTTINYGFPIMVIRCMTTLLRSVDRIAIVKTLGFASLGYYSIALMACSYLVNFLSSVAIVIIPHFQEKYGEQDSVDDLKNYFLKSLLGFAYLMPILIGFVWIVGPFAITWVLPEYTAGIAAMQVLIFGIFFMALSQPCQDFLIAINKQNLLFPILGFSFLVAVLAIGLALYGNYGIVGVAFGVGFMHFIKFSIAYFSATRHFSRFPAWRCFMTMLGSLCYLSVILGLMTQFKLFDQMNAFQVFLRLGVFLVLCIPYVYLLNREFSILRYIWNKLNSLRKK